MGFSLKSMIIELEEIAIKDQKPKKTLHEIVLYLAASKKYAEDCGVWN